MKPDKPTQDDLGEADRISARRYLRQVREFVAGGRVEPSARSAVAFVERLADDAERVERRTRFDMHPTRVSLDELVAKGYSMLDRMQALLYRALDRVRRRLRRR